MSNKYIITSNGTFLSQADIDQNELMHFKYIKREKTSDGHWRYYYDDRYLKEAKSIADNARTDSLKESANAINARDNARRAMKRAKNLYRSSNSKTYNKAVNDYFNSKKKESAASYRAEKYSEVSNKYIKKYKSMKLFSTPAKTLTKGLNAVSKFMSKIFD